MVAVLTLPVPWANVPGLDVNQLRVQSGRESSLTYDDGITLRVEVFDPSSFAALDALMSALASSERPGQVSLVAGFIPLPWRAPLRSAGVSFLDVSGVAEIDWPRIRISARRFGKPIRRVRAALPMQKGHGLVVQELLLQSSNGAQPSVGAVAISAGVSLPTASKAISQLEAHGLVQKHRTGTVAKVEVVDRAAIAHQLAAATSWPGTVTVAGYAWGRTIFDVASRLSSRASQNDLDFAVTGRVAANYLGIASTSSPERLRIWVDAQDKELEATATALGLEPASGDEANVSISHDRWRAGTIHRRLATLDGSDAWIANPLRIWCDLHDEPRGSEFAAQMWGSIADGA